MAPSDLSVYTQNEIYYGSNVARTKRMIAKLLLDWTTNADAVSGSKTKDRSDYLTAIYFDKLAELFCRIWDELKDQNKVRYSAAFGSQRGFHGPGRALRINRKNEDRLSLGTNPDDHRHHGWAFTTEIVEKLKPSLGNARVLFRLSGPAWKHTCKISSDIDPTQWESWLIDADSDSDTAFLTPIEAEYFKAVSQMICSLNKQEVRALGTHYRAEETCEDIKFNLRSWDVRFNVIMKLLKGEDVPVERASYELVSTTREVKRKSDQNRKDYESGWNKCLQACRSENVKAAFLAVQKSPDEIWTDETLQKFRLIADPILNFSIYIHRGLHAIGRIPGLSERENNEAENVTHNLRKGLPGVSLTLRDYESIQHATTEEWLNELMEWRKMLFAFIPPLRDLSLTGVP